VRGITRGWGESSSIVGKSERDRVDRTRDDGVEGVAGGRSGKGKGGAVQKRKSTEAQMKGRGRVAWQKRRRGGES